jgi:tRNA (cmo5U34)-methyltransferase
MPKDDRSVETFYNRLGPRYSEAIQRCVPRYGEMLRTLIDYIPYDLRPRRIVELGCGGGDLSALVVERYPEAEIHLVDLAAEMVESCRRRFAGSVKIHYHTLDFAQLDFEAGSFDLVVSSISIHHLDDAAKQALFRRVFSWLRDGGVLAYSDQFRGATDEIYATHLRRWQEEAFRLGCTAEEWDTWMRHQHDHDHHATLEAQLGWLRGAGFALVDCPWRHLLWTVLIARNPHPPAPAVETRVTTWSVSRGCPVK